MKPTMLALVERSAGVLHAVNISPRAGHRTDSALCGMGVFAA